MARTQQGTARMERVARRLCKVRDVGFLLIFVPACAMRPDKLPPVHRSYYRLFESPAERETFLHADEVRREELARSKGFAQAWSKLAKPIKDRILEAKVEVGFSTFAVHMAWGRPADEKALKARGRTLWLETYIQCTSGPKAQSFVFDHLECDGTSSESQVIFEHDRVIEIRALD